MTEGLIEQVHSFVKERHLFHSPCHLLLGLSGGADSMALLHILHRWPGVDLAAVHVHHGLRGAEADADAAFVQQQCAQLRVPLTVHRADVSAYAREQKVGLEEAGRQVRYALFDKLAAEGGYDRVVTAHNSDDQAETVLMHLLRGSGVDGLSGIPAMRGLVVRPLLSCSRQDIEAFCEAEGIPFVTDSSNADSTYRRNFCRHCVLPLLEQANPAVKRALCRLASGAAEDALFFSNLVEEKLKESYDGKGWHTEVFLSQPPSVRRRMLVRVITRLGRYDYTEAHIEALEHVLQSGGSVDVPGGRLLVTQGVLYLIADMSYPADMAVDIACAPGESCRFFWQGKQYSLSLMDAESFAVWKKVHKLFFKYAIAYDTIQSDLQVRSRRKGDRFHPAGRGVGKSLKKLFIEWRVPAHMRDAWPLLCDATGVLLVPGYGCDSRVQLTEKTKLFLVWHSDDETG